jgi:hypothetical protein
MLKMKNILPVFVALLVLATASTAFAQQNCSVASTPVSRDTDQGVTEPAGDLTFTCVQPAGGTATTLATMTVDYGNAITSSTAWPTGVTVVVAKPISIPVASVTGFGGVAPTIAAVPLGGTAIIITIPAVVANAGATPITSTFTLTGVLLNLGTAGSFGTGSCTPGRTGQIQAVISVSPGNNVLIIAGQNVATVVNSIQCPILPPTLGTNLGPVGGVTPGTILASNTAVLNGGNFTINVKENYIDFYRSQAQFNGGGATNGNQLIYTFSGIPTGVTLGGCAASMTEPAGSLGPVGTVSATWSATTAGTLTAAANTVTVTVATPADPTAIETIVLSCSTFTAGTTATLPFAPGAITVSVSVGPIGPAFGAGNAILNAGTTPVGVIPRYVTLASPALTVINIISATTHMIFPFVSIGNGFDTGLVVANTSQDPYGTTGAAGGSRPQNGTVALYFFPSQGGSGATAPTGTPFCVTTGGTATSPIAGGSTATTCSVLSGAPVAANTGMGSGGVLNAGGTWSVLGSSILGSLSPAVTAFNGYIIGIANFTNGHPTAFVADATFSGKFASGGPALVIPNPQLSARNVGTLGGAESVGH